MAAARQFRIRPGLDTSLMVKLKIGYWPLSKTLDSPGDRRRLVFWAEARGHSLVTDLERKVDVIVASENSDFNSAFFAQKKIPVIFDLVDAYLSPLNPYDDLARGLAKNLSGQISGGIKPFSHHIKDFCLNSNAVICSSIEQEELIREFNNNTHVVLDSHDEIPFIDPLSFKSLVSGERRVLWEGQPATIRGVRQISSVLSSVSSTNRVNFEFVTDENYFQFLNRFFERSTLRLLKKDLDQIADHISIVPWTPANLVGSAKRSSIAMIPIDLSVPMQRLKPENRLLIMWRLGLPCLTSNSPAYARVAQQAEVNATCDSLQEWNESLTQLLEDREYALTQIGAGQNYLRENHNRTILLEKWDRAIDSVMG